MSGKRSGACDVLKITSIQRASAEASIAADERTALGSRR
jgi:hypothetical protein